MPRQCATRVGSTAVWFAATLTLVVFAGCFQADPKSPGISDSTDLVRGALDVNAVWTGQLVYLAGGHTSNGSTPPLLAFDPDNGTMWVVKADVPSGIHGMGFDGRNLYLVQDGQERTETPNWHLGIPPRTWHQTEVFRMPAPVPAQENYDYTWYGSGGLSDGVDATQSVKGFRAIGNGSALFVVGGRTSAGDEPSDQIVSYRVPFGGNSVFGGEADPVVHMPDARIESGLGWDGQALYVFGGRIDRNGTDSILRYDPASGQVAVVSARLPPGAGLWNMSVVWNGASFFLLGGEDQDGMVDAIVAFDPGMGRSTLLAESLPEPRTRFAAAWTDEGAYVFGGQSSSEARPPVRRLDLPGPERQNLAPVVAFETLSYRAPDGRPELAVLLYGSHDPDGRIVHFELDWGESGPGNGTSTGGWSAYDTSFRYPRTGTYNVTITATDDRGGRGVLSRSIEVDPPLQQNPCYLLAQGTFVGTLNLTGNCNLTDNSYLQFGGVVTETRGPSLEFDHWSDWHHDVALTGFVWLEQDGRSIELWHEGCPTVTVYTDVPERHVTHCLERVRDTPGGTFQPARRPMNVTITPASGGGEAIAGHYRAYRLSDDPLLVVEIGDFGLPREGWCHCVQRAGHTSPSVEGTADVRVIVNEGTFVVSFNASMLENGTMSAGSRGSTTVTVTPRMVHQQEHWATPKDFEFDVALKFDASLPPRVVLRDYIPA